MPTFDEFIKEQNAAYTNFERFGRETRTAGLRRDPKFERYTGFFVNISHSPDVARLAAEFSRGLSELVRSTAYDPENVYTTLTSLAVPEEGFRVDRARSEHRKILDDLSFVAQEALQAVGGKRIEIVYDRYLWTDVVAIAAGIPNETFVELMSIVIDVASRRGLTLTPAWGAQMTLARFTRIVPAERLDAFFRFIEAASPPGRSVPTYMNVGYNVWEWNTVDPHATHGGHFVPYISIPLGRE